MEELRPNAEVNQWLEKKIDQANIIVEELETKLKKYKKIRDEFEHSLDERRIK